MSSKHCPHGEPVRWPTPNRRALETRRRELEDALLAEERRYADAHIAAVDTLTGEPFDVSTLSYPVDLASDEGLLLIRATLIPMGYSEEQCRRKWESYRR